MGTVNIVQYEPEIPQNTGNIMRTCVATNIVLHLIEPLGFSLDEKSIKRSGANYVKYLNYKVYKNWEEFLEKNIKNNDNAQMYFLTRYGEKDIFDVKAEDTSKDYYLVLGKESNGIPLEILKDNLENCIRLPMTDKVRALNLSNCVAIAVYEVLRQNNYFDLLRTEPFKGEDYLEN